MFSLMFDLRGCTQLCTAYVGRYTGRGQYATADMAGI
jgi:hypothetical protein